MNGNRSQSLRSSFKYVGAIMIQGGPINFFFSQGTNCLNLTLDIVETIAASPNDPRSEECKTTLVDLPFIRSNHL